MLLFMRWWSWVMGPCDVGATPKAWVRVPDRSFFTYW